MRKARLYVSYRDIGLFVSLLAILVGGYLIGSSIGYRQGYKQGRDRVWNACKDPGNMECPAYNAGGGVDKQYVQEADKSN